MSIRIKPSQLWFAAAVLFLTSCAREQDYVDVIREQQTAWNDVADILETIKDQESMTAAKADLVAKMEVCDKLAEKARGLPTPSPEFVETHRQKAYLLQRSIERTRQEVGRIQKQVPGGESFWRQFQSRHPGFMSAVQK